MSTPVPQPPALPLIGNILDVDPQNGLLSLGNLAAKYGEIFKLNILGQERYFVASVRLANELCDEKRFAKSVSGPLEQLRPGIGAGLFTAKHGEHDWEVAHRTLVPAFGPLPISQMYDEMYDIATQLVSKWARMGSDTPINVTDDYTRLTLDSIALCAMDKRFNSFYSSDMHPFIGAMVDFLVEGGKRSRRTRLESLLNPQYERKFQQDIDLMNSISREVIAHRRANPSEKKDLLNALLFGKDPKTGERLTDESIIWNMITFLIAGHETTSGLLSFTSYYIIKNPEVWQKAQNEVDTVVGKGPVKVEHMSKLPYLEAILREALRLYPTAPGFTVAPKPGTTGQVVIGGEYAIPADASILFLLPQIQRDPAVYGEDANEFRPERMYKENFTNLPPNSWKPFGNGARGCIGRPFAWQEALLTLALILQNFNLRLQDPAYEMKIKQTLTIKPDNLFMYATLRDGVDPIHLEKKMFAGAEENQSALPSRPVQGAVKGGKPMTILFGSNSGTCEGLAQSLAAHASAHGLEAKVKPLDSAVDKFPKDEPVVIITASYEGNPPDNAATFVEWLKNVDSSKISGAKVAVFGCGHRDWAATYQKVPNLIESELRRKGASALIGKGETNVAEGTIFDDFDTWSDQLWPTISTGEANPVDTDKGLDVTISTNTRATHLHHSVQDAIVVKNDILTKSGVPEKRHMEIRLPTSMTYTAGDYLAILPVNNVPTISRALRRFGLPWDAMMSIKKGSHSTIPTDKELPVTVVLGAYVELSGTPTKKNLATLVKYGGTEAKVSAMASKSVLDILEANQEIELPFSVYLSMLTPMRIRQYSISSSPLNDPNVASITFSVVDQEGHLGVATNYLRHLKPGTTIQVMVKKSHASFHLPLEDSTPVIMVAAGTGLAPFHGFVQERAAKAAVGKSLGEAALFIGCRSPEEDKIFADELAKWESDGIVKLFYAFSRSPNDSSGCKYAQDRLYHEREYVSELFSQNARAYICGSGRLGKGVADAVARISVEDGTKKGKECTYEEALKWWESLRGERYAVDVFD